MNQSQSYYVIAIYLTALIGGGFGVYVLGGREPKPFKASDSLDATRHLPGLDEFMAADVPASVVPSVSDAAGEAIAEIEADAAEDSAEPAEEPAEQAPTYSYGDFPAFQPPPRGPTIPSPESGVWRDGELVRP